MSQQAQHYRISLLAGALGALLALPAAATNGYFSHGYGIVAKGMGGAATATTFDAMGGANNPATMVWAGARVDVGADWFRPGRSASRSGAAIASLNGSSVSSKENFLIPEFGYNTMHDATLSFGVTAYGNGGLNTTYDQGSYQCGAPGGNNMLCGSGQLGIDMVQLIVAPTVSYKFHPNHSLGLSVLLGYQRFKAAGLQAFDNGPGFPPFTGAPGFVTGKGFDGSYGAGVRIGYYGRITDQLAVGAAYAPKMKMSKFDAYKGLFAGGGSFDIPSSFSLGLAWTPDPALTLALDYQQIGYGAVPSVANASRPVAPLGAANGPGFGWRDIEVVKLGAAWRMDDRWTLRGGYNRGGNPISAADVSFNILAPGVIKDHLTFGLSYALCKQCQLSLSYMHAPRVDVSGPSLFNGLFPAPPMAGGTETIGMRQHAIGIAYSQQL